MSVWETVGVGLILALAAFLFNLFQWLIAEKNNSKKAAGKVLIETIDKLMESSIEYWLTDYSNDAKNIRKKELELLIVSLTRILPKVTLNFADKIKDTEVFKFTTFSSQIFDIITGDDFSSESKTVNSAKCSSISFRCNDIKAEIMRIIS